MKPGKYRLRATRLNIAPTRMRNMISLLLYTLLACAPQSPQPDETQATGHHNHSPRFVPYSPDGGSVERVEPSRYLGLWYEIATTPSQQQAACSGTMAEYSLREEDTIGVINRCYSGGLDGRLNEIEATARPIDETFARLMVDFGFGFEAPYTVIELVEPPGDEPYTHAAVTTSNVQYWILSRTPQMPDDLYETILDRIAEQGGDTARLIRTAQPLNSDENL
jgi:apolipoprotein D and lipocalin family protein